MKNLIYLLGLILIVSCQKKTDKEILTEISNTIQQFEKAQYNFINETKNYKSPNSNYTDTGSQSFDFTKENKLGANAYTKFKRSIETYERFAIGDTLIEIIDKTNTIVKSPNSHPLTLSGNLLLYYNLFDLRESLPLALQDSSMTSLTITDTILSKTPSLSVKFKIKNTIIGGKSYKTEDNSDNLYQLIVREKDYFPLIWSMSNNNSATKFSFTNIQLNIDKSLWNYNPKNEYIIITGEEYRLREKNKLNQGLGNDFPAWELSSIRGKQLSNKSFKNKLTLYKFFFVGCIGSVNSNPFIEKLKKIYGTKLEIIGVETQNTSQKGVADFVKKHKLMEPAVINGKELANQLGVVGCPTYILVDKSGEIIFSSFADRTGLNDLIKKKL